jgi:shikimate kinase
MRPVLVLAGLPGAGKTTIGRRVAGRLGADFADSDGLVEAAAGRSVQQIFATDGEAVFRALEAAEIARALSEFDGVLALGGGALLDPGTRRAVAAAGSPVVLLRCSVRTLARRVGDASSRPLLASDPPSRLAVLAREREPIYREVATHIVHTDRQSSARVTAEILNLLGAPALPG